MSVLIISVHHCTRGSSQCSQVRKNKGIHIGKEEVNLAIHRHAHLCITKSMESLKRLPELISGSSKIAGCKISIQKIICIFYVLAVSHQKLKKILKAPNLYSIKI